MKLIRAAWMSWLAAALLFFSGTKGAGFFILALLAIGFGLHAFIFWRAIFGSRHEQPTENAVDAP